LVFYKKESGNTKLKKKGKYMRQELLFENREKAFGKNKNRSFKDK